MQERLMAIWEANQINNTTHNDTQQTTSLAIICVYAQTDKIFYTNLKTYLNLWEREQKIVWLEIQAGNDIDLTINANLQQADIILLLLSSKFLVSDECYMAMKTALQENAKRQVPVVPILARASDWKESACKDLRVLPANKLPIQ